MTDLTPDLQQLIDLTHTELQAAQDSLWDLVAEIEARRAQLIATLFPPGETPEAALAPLLATLQAQQQQLTALAQKAQKNLSSDLSHINKGNKARKAYGRRPY